MTWPNGKHYLGSFKQGKEHGQGKKMYPDKTVKEGKWYYGSLQEAKVDQSKPVRNFFTTGTKFHVPRVDFGGPSSMEKFQ